MSDNRKMHYVMRSDDETGRISRETNFLGCHIFSRRVQLRLGREREGCWHQRHEYSRDLVLFTCCDSERRVSVRPRMSFPSIIGSHCAYPGIITTESFNM